MVSNYLNNLVKEGHIPGGVLYVSKQNETVFFQSYGSFLDTDHIEQSINKNTIFDVASLTKIVGTLPSLLYLISIKEISLDQAVQKYLPKFKFRSITIGQLLQHTSGLPADLEYKDRNASRDVITEILNTELIYTPESKSIYSDLGMILLGKIIEKVADVPLDVFSKQYIFLPWGLTETTYLLPIEKKTYAASTEWYKDSYIQGEVHDEKAFQLGGVCGSAGIFSTAKDIAKFATHWLYPESQSLIPPEYLRNAVIHRQHNRGLGFEVWSGSGESLACGKHWSIGSFGHTGFTGTSVWVDPIHELIVVFLTNAVHFGRETKIRSIRKKLHSLIYSSFIEDKNIKKNS